MWEEIEALMLKDPDLKEVPDSVEKLIGLLLIRHRELNEPEVAPKTLRERFFKKKDHADEARQALYDALPTLLNTWLQQQK